MFKEKSILLVTGGGGFSWEAKVISEALIYRRCNVIHAYPEGSFESREYFLNNCAYLSKSLTHRSGYRLSKVISGFFYNFLLGLKVIKIHNCRKVIAIGDSSAIPFMLAARILGRRVTFVETITRTESLTRTCKIVYHFGLAHDMLVQWESLAEKYKNLSYKGSIL